MERDSADGYVLSLQKTDADWPCAAVWNFPCTPSGKLKIRVQIQPPFTGATLMLTDHFSVPFDAQDEFHSVYRIPIATDSRSGGAIPSSRWIDLELRWDADGRACRLFIDGQASVMLPQQRQSPGPSYLRIKCDALEPEQGRLLIDSVQISADGD
jgi:hypothetical protein